MEAYCQSKTLYNLQDMIDDKTINKAEYLTLKISCIVAFLYVGFSFLMGLFFTLIIKSPNIFYGFSDLSLYISLASGKITFTFALLNIILPFIALFGLIQIWHKLRIGFWVFSIPMTILCVLPFIFINISTNEIFFLTFPMIVLTAILITVLGFNYKKLYMY